jgi:hypothetical protein
MEKHSQGEGNSSEARAEQGGQASETRGSGGGRGRGNAANLSREARVMGGQRSAQVQVRDEHGQFAGRSDKSRGREKDNQQGGGSGGAGRNEGGGENASSRG